MPRDTKRIEALLKNTQANLDLVRAEMKDGASLQHLYDDLKQHEQTLSVRLKELKEFNAKEALADEAKAKEEADAKAKAEAEAKTGAGNPGAAADRAAAVEAFTKLSVADRKKALAHFEGDLKHNPNDTQAALAVEILKGLLAK